VPGGAEAEHIGLAATVDLDLIVPVIHAATR